MVDKRHSTSREQTAVALSDLRELSSRSDDSDCTVALQPTDRRATNVKVLANNSLVHVGNDVYYNFLLNVEGDRVSSTVKQYLQEIKRNLRFGEEPGNSSFVFTGIRDLSGRWYYWVAALVALSCTSSIAAAVIFTVNNLWMPTEQDVSDILAALHRAFWFLVVPLVTLSCMNLVSTALLSLSRAMGTQPALLVENSPERSTTNEDRDLVEQLDGGLQLMRRLFWRARPPCGAVVDNLLPVHIVVVCHTATRSPTDTEEIARIILGFQRYHMEERFLDDISYNFLIGADGKVYEGRGWTKVPGHARGRGRGTLAVAVIGNFVNQLPPTAQLDTLFRFLECGVRSGHLAEDYRLQAHCQVMATASPGAALLDTMVTWPRFDNSKPINCSSN